jgi:homogentisate 1,2-dioxygenase
MGFLRVRPREIAVIPRGVRWRVSLPSGPARGHIVETFSGHIDVPEIGVSGTLCLANIRDFEIPTAKYVDIDEPTIVLSKFGGMLHKASMKGSAFNAVGWQGNYYPFKYDLGKFMPLGSTLYDHQDPSIFTVLTCQSSIPDHPALDFLYMGPRWFVMEDTFQLPYFHRNVMSEFSGVISGGFDLSKVPKQMWGMCGLNNSVSPHGLSKEEVEQAITKKLQPERVPDNHHGFLFESW